MNNFNGVKPEKTGYRDLRYNNWHRNACGAKGYLTDLDKIVTEDPDMNENGTFPQFTSLEVGNYCMPVALIETKHGAEQAINVKSFQLKTISNLANLANLPAFCVVYYPTEASGDTNYPQIENEFGDHYQFYVIPVNKKAYSFINEDTQMTELMYATFLYRLRNMELPADVISNKLDDVFVDVPIPKVDR